MPIQLKWKLGILSVGRRIPHLHEHQFNLSSLLISGGKKPTVRFYLETIYVSYHTNR